MKGVAVIRSGLATIAVCVCALLALGAGAAQAGQIVYRHGSEIWAMNDDGSGQHPLLNASQVPGVPATSKNWWPERVPERRHRRRLRRHDAGLRGARWLGPGRLVRHQLHRRLHARRRGDQPRLSKSRAVWSGACLVWFIRDRTILDGERQHPVRKRHLHLGIQLLRIPLLVAVQRLEIRHKRSRARGRSGSRLEGHLEKRTARSTHARTRRTRARCPTWAHW